MKINFRKVSIACVLALGIGLTGVSLPSNYSPVPAVQAYGDNNYVAGYTIDPSSVWYDQNNRMFGAGVTDSDGNYFTATYRLVRVSSDETDVYESKNNGPWVQIGVINHEASYQIGNQKTGGPLFRRIADMAARTAGYQKMF